MPSNYNQLPNYYPERQKDNTAAAAGQLVVGREVLQEPDPLSQIADVAELLTRTHGGEAPREVGGTVRGFTADIPLAASYNRNKYTSVDLEAYYDKNDNLEGVEINLGQKGTYKTTDYSVYYEHTKAGRVLEITKLKRSQLPVQPSIDNMDTMKKIDFDSLSDEAQTLSTLLQGIAETKQNNSN